MAFHLFGTGKLIAGFEATEAVPVLGRVTRLPEEKVHEILLDGQRRRLASKDDRKTIERYRDQLLRAGLAVELVADESEEVETARMPVPEPMVSPEAPNPGTRRARSRHAGGLLTTVILIIAVLAVSAAEGPLPLLHQQRKDRV